MMFLKDSDDRKAGDDMEEIIAKVSRSRLFDGISPEEIKTLLTCISPVRRRYAKQEMIWQEGIQIQTVGLVMCGKVLMLRDDFWGNRSILGEALPGELFGESFACLPEQSAMVSVLAAEESEILFMEMHHIITICPQACTFHNRLIQNLMYILAEKNIMLSRKIDHLSRRTMREKLLAYLSYQAQVQGTSTFEIPFNRQQLADYLSVDRSALSQELGRMKRDGLIDFMRSKFTLYDGMQ